MDHRTIGQILSNPEWLRQQLSEERPIQPEPQTFTQANGYAAPVFPFQPAAPIQAQPMVPTRGERPPVEVRGTIAYVARYRAEYFNDRDPQGMMALAQTVIMGETGVEPGEAPPPWFPDVQFWIQTFERINPYADAQQAELERLHAAKLAEQLRREQLLYGEPGTFSREGTLTGLAAEPTRENGWQPGPIPGSRPDWLLDALRTIAESVTAIGERLEALERRDDGAAGAGPAVPADDGDDRDADRERRPGAARRDAGAGAGGGGDAGVHADVEAGHAEPDPGGAVRDRAPERGRAEPDPDPGAGTDRPRRSAPPKNA